MVSPVVNAFLLDPPLMRTVCLDRLPEISDMVRQAALYLLFICRFDMSEILPSIKSDSACKYASSSCFLA